jgi:hypothetical protein
LVRRLVVAGRGWALPGSGWWVAGGSWAWASAARARRLAGGGGSWVAAGHNIGRRPGEAAGSWWERPGDDWLPSERGQARWRWLAGRRLPGEVGGGR